MELQFHPEVRKRWEGDEPVSGIRYCKRVTTLNGIDILTANQKLFLKFILHCKQFRDWN